MNKPNVLFLADTTHNAGAVHDHIHAVTSCKSIEWFIENPLINKVLDKLDLTLFDAIGIHYSIKPYNNYYLSTNLKNKISLFNGYKFIFLQDEYQSVNKVQEYLYNLRFNTLFTLVNKDTLSCAYPDPRLKNLEKITVLTGYVNDAMKNIQSPQIKERMIDVSYRGRRCEYWLGSLAYEKQLIAEEFQRRVGNRGLSLDISLEESHRLYGEKWLNLLRNSKAVLATESGASIWDFDGQVKKKTNIFLAKNKSADFDIVYDRVLKKYDGIIVYNAISPRVFEAAASRTPMIMFPGYYSGICKAGEHYIPLEKDFSNIDEVIKKLRDYDYLQNLADNVFNDLILSDLYHANQLGNLVGQKILTNWKDGNSNLFSVGINTEIQTTKQRYKLLNKFRIFMIETLFVIQQGLRLVFDPKISISKKMSTLYNGIKRYIIYLSPRLKKSI